MKKFLKQSERKRIAFRTVFFASNIFKVLEKFSKRCSVLFLMSWSFYE